MKDINFFKFHYFFLALSFAIVVAMVVLLTVRGFNYGTDFRGGLEATVVLTETAAGEVGTIDSETLREQLASSGLNTEVQEILTRQNTFLIRFAISEADETTAVTDPEKTTETTETTELQNSQTPETTDNNNNNNDSSTEDTQSASSDVQIPFAPVTESEEAEKQTEVLTPATKLKQALAKHYDETEFSILQSRLVGSVLSAENRTNAIWTSLVVLVLIIGYLTLRFEFPFALAAISAVIYDVMVILAFVLLLGDELTILIIVAILTTFGYSVNDTIVLLDRIREETPTYTSNNYKKLVNLAINRVLGRTIITSFTTLAVVMALYLATTGDYRIFSFYLIIGLLSGTYSSIYIAPTFLFLWNRYVRSFLETT